MEEIIEKEQSNNEILESSTQSIVNELVKETNMDKIKDLTNLFNVNQVKKNALRMEKLDSLLDSIHDEASKRLEKHPNEISNKELIDYMNAVQNSLEKSQKSLSTIEETPMIQFNQQNNINIGDTLSDESKEKVIDVIQKMLGSIKELEEENKNEQ